MWMNVLRRAVPIEDEDQQWCGSKLKESSENITCNEQRQKMKARMRQPRREERIRRDEKKRSGTERKQSRKTRQAAVTPKKNTIGDSVSSCVAWSRSTKENFFCVPLLQWVTFRRTICIATPHTVLNFSSLIYASSLFLLFFLSSLFLALFLSGELPSIRNEFVLLMNQHRFAFNLWPSWRFKTKRSWERVSSRNRPRKWITARPHWSR